jgi:hypothetical protein
MDMLLTNDRQLQRIFNDNRLPPFPSSNIPQSPANSVHISQQIQYRSAFFVYGNFLMEGKFMIFK